MESHPAIQAQEALVGAAEAGIEGARWQFFPTPSVSAQRASTSGSNPNYAGDKSVTVLSLDQPLWTWGRLTAGMNKAQAQSDSALASRAEAQQQVAIKIVQNYGEWFAAYYKRLAYTEGVGRHLRLKEQVSRRVQEGPAAASDLTLANGRLVAMRAELSAAKTQEQIALARLVNASGMTIESSALAAEPAEPWVLALSLTELLGKADASSPGLAVRRAQAQVQLASIAEIRARLMPEVRVRFEQQYGNLSIAGAPSPERRVFLSVSTQFGAGLSSLSAITEASRRHAAALADIATAQKNLTEQIVADHAMLADAESRRNDLKQAVDFSEQILQAWDRQYFSGRKTWQDLMNSARELVQTQAQLADLDALKLVSSWRLALLTGHVPQAYAAKQWNGDERKF